MSDFDKQKLRIPGYDVSIVEAEDACGQHYDI
jgi:hypothetical protein